MLETIRELAREQASVEGVAADAAEQHAAQYLELTELAAPELTGKAQRSWLDRLEADLPNIRGALERLTDAAPADALRMGANLTWFCDVRGYYPEALTRLTAALARAPRDSEARGRALLAGGRMALNIGDPKRAEPLLGEAHSLAARAGDKRLAAVALSHLGWAADQLGKPELSAAHHDAAVATARDADDQWTIGLALNNAGVMSPTRRDNPRARSVLMEALLVRRRLDEPRAIALTAGNLALLTLAADELDEAEALADEALARAREIDYRPMIATALGIGAEIALARADISRAEVLLREQFVIAARHDASLLGSGLSVAATLAAQQGDGLRAAMLGPQQTGKWHASGSRSRPRERSSVRRGNRAPAPRPKSRQRGSRQRAPARR
jgi:tetratricopeptide (TPR) repeat protein